MRILLLIILLLAFGPPAFSQKETALDKAFQEEYQKRIRQEMLFGVYIPVDLEDSFNELIRLSDAQDIEKFKQASEAVIRSKLHFGLGKWISYNWQFYEGSRFSHYLRGLGLSYPDDMVQFVLVSFHRKLNDHPLDIEGQIRAFQEKRERELRERESRKDTLLLEKRIRKQ